ncbi:hypothetical protein C8R45DRAFT_1136607 [Mycena sanguinolenta]|nr:hypothetical protein C8R45DRAFT_1136607 [Mycena sanguinolenta]
MPPSPMSEPLWVEEYSKSIKYSGSWSREYGTIYHESAVMRTTELAASMSLEFEGIGINFIGTQGWDHGIFTVALDGQNTIVDGSCCIPNGASPPVVQFGTVPQVVQFEATNLTDAKHVLTITNNNAGPLGTVLQVDAFVITGAVKFPAAETTTAAPPSAPRATAANLPGSSAQPATPPANPSTPSPQTSSSAPAPPPMSNAAANPAASTSPSPSTAAHNAGATPAAPEVLFTSDGTGGSGQDATAHSPDDAHSADNGENARLLTELEEDEGFYHIKSSGRLSP